MRSAPAIFSLMCIGLSLSAQDKKPVSFEKDIVPIFKTSCLSCHKPDKKKGKLDMSTYVDLMKGGKQGSPIKPGDPTKSLIVEMISGKEPEMPEKGDALKPEQVELISRWIKEGAKKN
jgi:mono/diheme cytochrome c family protein